MHKFIDYHEIGISRPRMEYKSIGRLYNCNLIHGIYLLGPRNMGKELVIRLKDSNGMLEGEIDFWASLMARMLVDVSGIDCVSFPPSSKKREYYLAGRLAKIVSDIHGLPLHEHFVNNKPRGTRANMAGKLHETKDYSYIEDCGRCKRLLMVEDVVCTRTTANACVGVARSRDLFWLFLYASKSNG